MSKRKVAKKSPKKSPKKKSAKKARKPRRQMEVKTIPASQMMLLPPRPEVCQECATKHEPELPHNKDSLYYQMKFQMKHDRGPTWEDAMAHCTDEMKKLWRTELAKRGIAV